MPSEGCQKHRGLIKVPGSSNTSLSGKRYFCEQEFLEDGSPLKYLMSRRACSAAFHVANTSNLASLDEFVAIYTVRIFPPDAFVFLSPAAHQIRANKDISSALIASEKMTSADVEQSDFMAKQASDICEKLAKIEVARHFL